MPYEMVDYVNTQTELRAISRLAGSVDLLKRFVAAGFPVVIEKGLEGPDFDGWMGHYELITGYDDALSLFTAEDSYMGSGLKLPYTVIESYWRAFNGAYIIVYPISREQEMLALLGDHAQEGYNRQFAAQLALEESTVLAGRDQFFALFNRGSSLVSLLDYAGAASAYDQAFALYPSIPQKERPWRMMWYQTGPYWAYYYTGRYQDVVDLATKTLDNMSEPVLEESYYWRGLAFDALGDRQKAIEDLQMSEKTHPGFLPAVEQMRQLGVEGK
jgi:tetratricopeptide (TPR) repeat protein